MRPVNRNSSLYFNAPKYQFRAPPEFGGRELLHPVVIVGAGPVGVTAALELSRHGVVSVVIDDKDTVNDGSRAICIARHRIECLQQLGVEQRFVHKALPWTHGTSYYRDQPVYRLQMPHSEHERFHPMYNLQQQYIEQFLIDRAQEDPLIDLRWCSRLVDPDQNDEQASLRVETVELQRKVIHQLHRILIQHLIDDDRRIAANRGSNIKCKYVRKRFD